MSCTCEPGTNLPQPHAPWDCQWSPDPLWDATDCSCGHSIIDPACPEHGWLLAAEFEVSA